MTDDRFQAAEHGEPEKQRAGIAVIGAVNVDICATPADAPVRADSNPGRITVSMGGVGHNIAHNLRLLGQPVSLITVYGDDSNGERIRLDLERLGIDTADSFSVRDCATSCYVFITDEQGEMLLAVSDMEICERLTPQVMEDRLDRINQACLCVIDTNLPEETIRYLAEHVSVPLFVDPVSTAKMRKLTPVLPRIHTFKPNLLEAELLSGIPITDEASLRTAASMLLSAGIQRVFITLGAKGVLCADQTQMYLLSGVPAYVRSATGGGDCFMAALAYAYRRGYSLKESGTLALAAGAICVEGEHTINDSLSAVRMHERAGISIC